MWGYDFDVDTNVVDVFVGYLRRALEAIRTTRGGADAMALIHTWHQAEALFRECEFIVASRPGYSLRDVAESLPEGLRRRLDVSDFGTPVQSVTTFQVGDRVVIIDWSDAALASPVIDLVTWLAWSKGEPDQQQAGQPIQRNRAPG